MDSSSGECYLAIERNLHREDEASWVWSLGKVQGLLEGIDGSCARFNRLA